MNKKNEILKIIKQRNITQLIHFTNKKNVSSIIKNGLLNNDELKRRNLKYISNDPERRDNWTYSISLSITNKNSDLYEAFKYRQKLSDNDFYSIGGGSFVQYFRDVNSKSILESVKTNFINYLKSDEPKDEKLLIPLLIKISECSNNKSFDNIPINKPLY